MKTLNIGFVGLGLIGGSIAKALKKKRNDITIYAYDINPKSLEDAKADGIVDKIVEDIDETFADCDYIFLCAPVQKNDSNLLFIKKFIKEDCVLTDVGSVKTDIHKHIQAAGLTKQFIGGHPMTGSERTGYQSSKASFLENAYYIITPTEETTEEKLANFKALIESTGALPLILDYKEHDYVTAAISHLPHVISASLVNLVQASDSEEGIMKMVAAGGFKDITRISSSSASMWQQICLTNTENISNLLDKYIKSLTEIKAKIDSHNDERIYEFFSNAREYRESFANTSSGPIKRSFSITVEIADEAGALAKIASILAVNDISIKNIGIVHNREQESGALRIEFHNEKGLKDAVKLLTGFAYTVHEKKI